MAEENRGNWGSKMGYILAASGSAVGLGNLWRFPNQAGQNGGGVFLFIYLVAILLIAMPVLVAENALGRFTGKNPVGAFKAIRPGTPWKLVGYLGVLAGIMILSFYGVVAGWSLGYFYKGVAGQLNNLTAQTSGGAFGSFVGDVPIQLLLTAAFMFLTIFVVSRGVSSGIEKASKILMPALLAILLLLMFRSLTLEGAGKGLAFYLTPDFTKITPTIVINAMGQAFFSLSLGMGTMITYGSYLKKNENLPNAASWVAFFDTFIAVMAGFIIFPAMFAQGMSPDAGSGTLFEVIPVIFAKIPGGAIFCPLFFALLCIAALTSTVSLLEVPTSYRVDEKKWSRKKAAVVMGIVTFVFAIPSALSTSVPFFQKLPIVNTDFLSLMNFVWGSLALAVGALFICIFVGYVWKTSNAIAEIKQGAKRFAIGPLWAVSVKYLSPILIILILATTIIALF
ncbi:MAG: sodium-dependent transporter [bacterium]|nr:sodium-dependent transporter [bacterium]